MKKLGQNPSEADLIEMIQSVDDNGDNEIDFGEFLILMKSRIGERDPEKELRDAFAVFDSDGSGSIDRRELKRLMKKLGQALSDAELDAMMAEVDTNGDGEISFEEFKAMMVRPFALRNRCSGCGGNNNNGSGFSEVATKRRQPSLFTVFVWLSLPCCRFLVSCCSQCYCCCQPSGYNLTSRFCFGTLAAVVGLSRQRVRCERR